MPLFFTHQAREQYTQYSMWNILLLRFDAAYNLSKKQKCLWTVTFVDSVERSLWMLMMMQARAKQRAIYLHTYSLNLKQNET